MNNSIAVPLELLQTIANYLAERPWREVNNLLTAINQTVAYSQMPKSPVEETKKEADAPSSDGPAGGLG